MATDIQAALISLMAAGSDVSPPPAGDWRARRFASQATLDAASGGLSLVDGIEVEKYTTTAIDGAQLDLLLYRCAATDQPGSAALYLHGGGMIAGWHRAYDLVARSYVAASGVPLLSVRYRVAPEHPYLIPVEDCYAALTWLAAHAKDLGVHPTRIAVMGGSAGGGLAAGVALLARDRRGPPLAQQVLFYPMLDDRAATVDPHLQPFLTWSYDDNATGWGALLGDRADSADISPYVAPARAQDLSDLAPAYIDVGELDIFRDESMVYARRLTAAGVSAELHVLPGAPHAFEIFAPNSGAAQSAVAARIRRLKAM
jgi:acetyl esterase/lipase